METENQVLQALAIGALRKGTIAKMQTAKQIMTTMSARGQHYDLNDVKHMLRYLITNRLVRFYDNAESSTRWYGLTKQGIQYYADQQMTAS